MTIGEMKAKCHKHDVFILAVLAFASVLTVVIAAYTLGQTKPIMLYQDEIVSISRSSGSISVLNAQTGE